MQELLYKGMRLPLVNQFIKREPKLDEVKRPHLHCPFFFYIHDMYTGAVIFVGCVISFCKN